MIQEAISMSVNKELEAIFNDYHFYTKERVRDNLTRAKELLARTMLMERAIAKLMPFTGEEVLMRLD